MAKPMKLSGRIWALRGPDGAAIENIDTDMIYHNRHLAVTDMNEMAQFIFGNLDGWRDFPEKVKPGDILFVGKNFGSGSSRQHAVDGFIALGIQAIVGESFGAIYWRNAVNAGMPVLRAPDVFTSGIESGQEVEIDLTTGEIKNLFSGKAFAAEPMGNIQMDVYKAGGLFEYGSAVGNADG